MAFGSGYSATPNPVTHWKTLHWAVCTASPNQSTVRALNTKNPRDGSPNASPYLNASAINDKRKCLTHHCVLMAHNRACAAMAERTASTHASCRLAVRHALN